MSHSAGVVCPRSRRLDPQDARPAPHPEPCPLGARRHPPVVHDAGGLVCGVDGVLVAHLQRTGTLLSHVRTAHQLRPETPALPASQLHVQGDIVVGILWATPEVKDDWDETPSGLCPPAEPPWGLVSPACSQQLWSLGRGSASRQHLQGPHPPTCPVPEAPTLTPGPSKHPAGPQAATQGLHSGSLKHMHKSGRGPRA